jgi:hypothetical protein
MKKILLAGGLGGAAFFLWGAVAHTVLGLGSVGMKVMPEPAEATVLATLRGSLNQSGFYFFPGIDPAMESDPKAVEEWHGRLRQGPWGLLIFHPLGTEPMSAGQLLRQLAADVFIGLLLAWLVVRTRLGFPAGAVAIAVIGLVAATETNFSYWNWYGFPGNYTLGQMTIVIVGYAIMGTVIALLTRSTARSAA